MSKVQGLEGLQPDQINFEIQRGGKFIAYGYCISVLVMTFKRGAVHFVRADESRVNKGVRYSAISLLLGWWGIPWGPIWTISTMVTNFQGGKDVTSQVVPAMNEKLKAMAATIAK